jgi:hypothetical protein
MATKGNDSQNEKRRETAMRNYVTAFSLTAVLLLLSLAGATNAHHGIAAWYDPTKSVTVKGTVTSFDWTNPHAYVYLDAKDEKGRIEKWTAEMGSLGMLARHGWRKDTVKAGDDITVIGKPAKDGKPTMILDKAVLANGQELTASDVIPGTPVGPPRETKE